MTAQMALLWAALVSENAGDVAVRRVRPGGTHAPSAHAVPRRGAARPAVPARDVAGDHAGAARHAEVAVPDPAPPARRRRRPLAAGRARHAPLLDGDLDAAERILDGSPTTTARTPGWGRRWWSSRRAAELELASGDIAAGLRTFDDAVGEYNPIDGVELGGLSPWVLLAASGSLVARVRHGSAAGRRAARPRAARPAPARGDSHDRSAGGGPSWTSRSTGCCWLRSARGHCGTGPRSSTTTAYACWWSRSGGPTTAASRSWRGPRWRAGRATCAGLLDELSAEYADRPAADLVEEARAVCARWLHLPGETSHRQRGEDRDDREAAEQGPADLGGHGARCWPGRAGRSRCARPG